MKHKVIHALEAIAHQGESMLFKELVLLFKQVKEMPPKGIKRNTLENLGISKMIARHTGIKTVVAVDRAMYPNAWIAPPHIDANHVLVDNSLRSFWDWTDYVEDTSSTVFGKKTFITGTVDLGKGKIGGDFSTIECPMTVTTGLLTMENWSPEMITTVILHELGHVFTYFEYFGRVSTFNGALNAATQSFMKAESREEKLKLVQAMDAAMGLKLEDPSLLVNARSKEAFQTVIARAYLVNRTSSLGTDIYDMTLWESQADMFAQRMGSGKYGVQAEHALYQYYGGAGHRSMVMHLIFTLCKVALFFGVLLIGGFGILALLFMNPAKKIYDDPRARIDRLRNDMVASLKSPNLTPEEKATVAEDLKECDLLIQELVDRRGLIEFFYTSILPSGRREYSQRAFQLEMEKLVANELMVSSTRLGALAKRL